MQIHNVPCSLRNAYKAWCDLRGVTMTAKLESLIRKALEDVIVTPIPVGPRKGKEALRDKRRKTRDGIYCSIWLRKFPKRLRIAFRQWCWIQGRTMEEVTIDMLRDLVRTETSLPLMMGT